MSLVIKAWHSNAVQPTYCYITAFKSITSFPRSRIPPMTSILQVSFCAIFGPTAALPYVCFYATGPFDVLTRTAQVRPTLIEDWLRKEVTHAEAGGMSTLFVRRDW